VERAGGDLGVSSAILAIGDAYPRSGLSFALREAFVRRPSDVSLLYAARAVRGFGDGFAVIILPAYLTELGFGPLRIGIVASAALLGTAAITLAVGMLGARHDLRNLLLIGAFATAATGLAFAGAEQFAPIVAIGFMGTINPSSGDIGFFIPLEHAFLAREVSDHDRTHTFAHYSLIGGLSTAAGSLVAAAPAVLVLLGASTMSSLKIMFCAYASLGLAAAILYRCLPQSRLQESAARATSLGPSRNIVYKLAALFSLDAFAGGFAVQSLVALWLFERFDLSLAAASVFFFWSNVLAAFSYPVAARLAKRFGLVNTMVFTHIPSSVCLILAALSPNLIVVLALLLIRAALSQMDVPTRTSYVMAVVTPAERPAAASVTAVPRSLASSLSPAVAGALLASPFSGLPLVLCGLLKIVYDLTLLFSFRHTKPPEEQMKAPSTVK
jgi:MFS family permease